MKSPCDSGLSSAQDLVAQLGHRFPDVLVGDALYLPAPFVKEVERLDLVWAFTLKENPPKLLARPSVSRWNLLRAFTRNRTGRFNIRCRFVELT